ncbi:MAG: hypothetical protein Q4A79_02665 [Candidatus Saccharibacteria bacterium]|nr:hypothetical protein [Candidatus Saccharibacteria bacterium]
MKRLAEDFKKLYRHEKITLVLMAINLLGSIALFVFSITNLSPESATIKIGYGDIGGYRDGSWFEILSFPILAVVYGVFHNIIAARVYREQGSGMVKFFTLVTMALIAGTFVVLSRILGKS